MRWKLLFVLALFAAACGGDSEAERDLLGRELSEADDEAETDDHDDPSNADQPDDDQPDDPEPAATGEDRSAELVGTWDVTFYALPDGGGMTNVVSGNAPIQITFTGDGSLGFHTGCNAGGGSYTTSGTYYVPDSALDDQPEGQAISISEGVADAALCEGFLGDQDADLPAAWQQATRFRLDGERLILSAEFFLVEAERA